jgi:hypothetical protein
MEVDEGIGQNVIVIENREQIIGLCVDLDDKKESSKLCHSVVVIPASLIPAKLCQSNINRMFARLLSIRRHLDCKVIIVVEPRDVLEKRIVRYIADENIIS